MSLMDYLLIVLILGYCAYIILRKKKNICCGDCSGCSGCHKKMCK
ncbi:MAG: FeoB-associated Cys-rich membrane protein [Oscillospiraceae bacterium]|nr:FeoB-associated Cys-rich membrane protein [Oscillospiraceae bacterium]